MALLELVRGMAPGITAHGFRSTFRDWVAQETEVADAVAEASLAHAVEGKAKAAYLRTAFFKKRRDLMQAWVIGTVALSSHPDDLILPQPIGSGR